MQFGQYEKVLKFIQNEGNKLFFDVFFAFAGCEWILIFFYVLQKNLFILFGGRSKRIEGTNSGNKLFLSGELVFLKTHIKLKNT